MHVHQFGNGCRCGLRSGRDLYYGFNGFDPETSEEQVFLARSDDLGQTWEETGPPRVQRDLDEGEMGLDGLPSIAVDPNDAERVHVAWMSNWGSWRLRGEVVQGQDHFWDIVMRPYVASSTDGGASFTAPVNLVAEDDNLWLTDAGTQERGRACADGPRRTRRRASHPVTWAESGASR